jgi:hypothetical protein
VLILEHPERRWTWQVDPFEGRILQARPVEILHVQTCSFSVLLACEERRLLEVEERLVLGGSSSSRV